MADPHPLPNIEAERRAKPPMTHTPGPWRIGTAGSSVVCDTEIPQFQTAGSVDAYGGHLVAESIARENLAIISAAPEMLEALKDIVLQYGLYTDDDLERISMRVRSEDDGVPMSRHWAEKIIAARAAIAKARGT